MSERDENDCEIVGGVFVIVVSENWETLWPGLEEGGAKLTSTFFQNNPSSALN